MEQYGEVLAVREQVALVRVRRHSACSQCGRCGMGVIGGEPLDPEIEVRNSIGAREGDVVKITMNTRHLMAASFMVYLLPVLGLILGIFLGQFIPLEVGRQGDLAGVFTGLLFMGLIYVFVRKWGRKMSASPRFKPVAVAVVEERD